LSFFETWCVFIVSVLICGQDAVKLQTIMTLKKTELQRAKVVIIHSMFDALLVYSVSSISSDRKKILFRMS